MDEIRFNWDGKSYTVEMRAYDLNRIALPDGRVLEVGKWLESMPPQPREMRELNHLFGGQPAEDIAHHMNAVLAREEGYFLKTCSICHQPIQGEVQNLTAITTEGGREAHFDCYYPLEVRSPGFLELPRWAIGRLPSETAQWFRPT